MSTTRSDDHLTGLVASWCVRQLPVEVRPPLRDGFAEAVQVASTLACGGRVHRCLVQDALAALDEVAPVNQAAARAVGCVLEAYTTPDRDRSAATRSCAYWAARAVSDPARFQHGLTRFRELHGAA